MHPVEVNLELFRSEVVSKRRSEGRPALHFSQPVGSWWATILIGALFIGGLAAASLVSVPASLTLRGTLTSSISPVRVTVPRSGTVRQLFVSDGLEVRAGARMLGIEVEQPTLAVTTPTGESLSALVRARLAMIRQAPVIQTGQAHQVQGLLRVRESLTGQVARLDAQIATSGRMVAMSQQSLASVQPLIDRGFISRAELDRRQQAVLGQQLQEQALRQRRFELIGQADELAGRIAQLRSEAAATRADFDGRLAELDSRIALANAGQTYFIEAPMDGLATSIRTSVGHVVQPGTVLFVIVPSTSSFVVELLASPENVGKISVGQAVEIEYDSFPASTHGAERGVVKSVARAPIPLGEGGAEAPVYIVRVQFTGQSRPPTGSIQRTIGMTVRARVLGRYQSLLGALTDAIIG